MGPGRQLTTAQVEHRDTAQDPRIGDTSEEVLASSLLNPARRDAAPAEGGRKLIRKRELLKRVPYNYTTVWRLMRANEFPASVKLGPNAVAWYEDEVDGDGVAPLADSDGPFFASPRPM